MWKVRGTRHADLMLWLARKIFFCSQHSEMQLCCTLQSCAWFYLHRRFQMSFHKSTSEVSLTPEIKSATLAPGSQSLFDGIAGIMRGAQKAELTCMEICMTEDEAAQEEEPKTPFQRLHDLRARAAKEGLKPEIKAAYEAAIDDSSEGTSARLPGLEKRLKGITTDLSAVDDEFRKLESNPPMEIMDLVKQGKTVLAELTGEERNEFAELAQSLLAASGEERKEILEDLRRICPQFVEVIEKTEEAVTPIVKKATKLNEEKADVEGQIIGERNQAAATRMEYAEQLLASPLADDKQEGRKLLLESVRRATPEDRHLFEAAALNIARDAGIELTLDDLPGCNR